MEIAGTPARELEEVAEEVRGGDEDPRAYEDARPRGAVEEILYGDVDRGEQEPDGDCASAVPERGEDEHQVEEVGIRDRVKEEVQQNGERRGESNYRKPAPFP